MPTWDETGTDVPELKLHEPHWTEEKIFDLQAECDRLRAELEKLRATQGDIYHIINEHLKISAPGVKEPVREAIARALSLKLSAKLKLAPARPGNVLANFARPPKNTSA